jgi:site-specific recombinase XerD
MSDVETYIEVDGVLLDASLQPAESELQNAFAVTGTGTKRRIVIDMNKARECARDMIRAARKAAFEANDAATIRAMHTDDNSAMTAAKSKAVQLRTATEDTRIDAAATPAELLNAVEVIVGEF